MVPTPALTELLVKADKARDDYLRTFSKRAVFSIESFDTRAATECALRLAEAWPAKEKNKINKVKFKFDWQIIAIAASRNARAIYSDDSDIARYAKRISIPVYNTDELELPLSSRQQRLEF